MSSVRWSSRLAAALRDALASLAVGAAALGVVAGLRGRLFDEHRRVHETSEVYTLPPPDELVALSLGHRSALADYLWANLLVAQGLRMQERRRFETICDHFDAINALDPTFRDPYLHVDALVTIQVGQTSFDEVVRARRILERGAEARPDDAEVWLNLGQFVAYIAPAGLIPDPEVKKRWRKEGAEYLARAAELGAENANVSWQAIGGATILKRAGEREAAIRFLERTLAVTEDPELRADVQQRLFTLLDEKARDAAAVRRGLYEHVVARDVTVRSTTERLVLGPPRHVFACVGRGPEHAAQPVLACATSWRDWAAAVDAQR